MLSFYYLSHLQKQIVQMLRDQLKSMETVGHILNVIKFSIKIILVEKVVGGENDVTLLSDVFQLLPEKFCQDPVKVR
jgi:hypothetical protein